MGRPEARHVKTAASDERPFGVLLRQLRLAAGLSREALAEEAGLSADAVATLERGERASPRLSTISSLANALSVEHEVRADLLLAAGYARRGLAPDFPRVQRQRLPLPPSPLIGREADLARAGRLLQPHALEARVVTLLGPGGVGKTRLALEVAAATSRGTTAMGPCSLTWPRSAIRGSWPPASLARWGSARSLAAAPVTSCTSTSRRANCYLCWTTSSTSSAPRRCCLICWPTVPSSSYW
jgi:transcriptional regulator with XRE-family HTH domain